MSGELARHDENRFKPDRSWRPVRFIFKGEHLMDQHNDRVLSGIDQYVTIVTQHLEKVFVSQRQVMANIADVWTDVIQQDHLIYTFGSGHSRYIAGELFFRAGGLGAVMVIDDPSEGLAERVEGYAVNFMGKYDIQPGDALVIASQSGINPVPIEVALEGKQMGATVIAVTSLAHSQPAEFTAFFRPEIV
jgi:uncharacterized phosphosugar-binding protein